jgi:hypothetical protein
MPRFGDFAPFFSFMEVFFGPVLAPNCPVFDYFCPVSERRSWSLCSRLAKYTRFAQTSTQGRRRFFLKKAATAKKAAKRQKKFTLCFFFLKKKRQRQNGDNPDPQVHYHVQVVFFWEVHGGLSVAKSFLDDTNTHSYSVNLGINFSNNINLFIAPTCTFY